MPSIASTLLLSAALTSAAPPPCVAPVGVRGPLSELGAPPGSAGPALAAYAECLKNQAKLARENPMVALGEREAANRAMNTVVTWGKLYLRNVPLGGLATLFEDRLRSSVYTDEVKAVIRGRYETYQGLHQRAVQGLARDPEAARDITVAWLALRAEFQKMHDTPGVLPEEKALLQEKMAAGDILTQSLVFDALAASQNLSAEQVNAALARLGLRQDQLAARVEENLASMTALLEKELEQKPADKDGALTARQIGEYAVLSQGLIGVAARTGLMKPDEAAVLTQLVSGVSQISAAAALLNDRNSYVTLAGPYGMAVGGALVLADALQRPRASEGQQVMRMLAQISRQIARLQETVEAGFAETHEQINQSELRVMGRLAEILRSTQSTQAQVEMLRSELQEFRHALMEIRKNERAALNQAFAAQIAYDDDRCLRSFSLLQTGARRQCLNGYASLVRDFTTHQNARLVGERTAPLDARSNLDEQAAALALEYARTADSTAALVPVHKPALDMISGRVRLFLALNPQLLRSAEAREMVRRLDGFDTDYRRYTQALTAPAFVARVEADYSAEMRRLLRYLDQRAAVYADTIVRTEADEVHAREVERLNEPSSMRAMGAAFRQTGMIAGRITGIRDNLDHLTTGDTTLRLLPASRALADKLDNYAAVAGHKDGVASGVFPERLDGHLWVGPCNPQSGFPMIPIARRRVAAALPARAVALSAASRTAFSLCYTANLERSSDFVSNQNTTTGMDVFVARIASIGYTQSTIYPNGVLTRINSGFPRFCQEAPAYFAQHYAANPEYSSAWEKCHGNHVHHELRSNSDRVRSLTVVLSLNLAGYRAPLKSFSRTMAYANDFMDGCFLPFDRNSQPNKAALLMPFQQQYPLPITQACPGADDQLVAALPQMRGELEDFLALGRTRREGEVGSVEVTYDQALQATLRSAAEQNYSGFVASVFADPASSERLDRMHVLLTAARYLRGEEGLDPVGIEHLSAAELREYVAFSLRDPERKAIRSAESLWPGTAAK